MKANSNDNGKWPRLGIEVLTFLRTGFEDHITVPELGKYVGYLRLQQERIVERDKVAELDQSEDFARLNKLLGKLMPDPADEPPF